MHKYIALLILCFTCLLGNAQTAMLDSLNRELMTTKVDEEKLPIYSKLVQYSMSRSADDVCSYTREGLTIADEVNIPKWIAHFNYLLALCLEQHASREEAITQYLKAKSLYETNKDTINVVRVHAALVSRYNDIGKIEKALEHYNKGIGLLPKGESQMAASLNNRIGIIYDDQGKPEVALRYFKLNLPIYTALNDDYGLGFTYMNIGVIYDESSINPDSALYYLEEGLTYNRRSERTQEIALNLGELSSFHINNEDYERALVYVLEAIEITKAVNASFFLSSQYAKLALVYSKLDEHNKAIAAAKKGLQMARETGQFEPMKSLLGVLATSSYATDQFKEAYLYENERMAVRDSLFSIENQRVVEELEQQYKAEQKQVEIDEQTTQLAKQRIQIISVGAITVLLLIISFLLYRVSKHQRNANNQLHQLSETKSRFFANISHELRTPLTLIIAPIENAIETVKSKSAKGDLKLALSNSRKLLTLVNEVLDLSKLDSDKMELNEQSVMLEKLMRRIFFNYHSLSQIRGFILSLSYHLPEDLVIQIDIEKFEKVLNNLLSNAFKHSKEGGVITLRASEEKDRVKIIVSDTGNGIPEEQLDRIFERFYQVENEDEPLQGGTGIGLAYAKEIAQIFNGELYVKSTVGKGSDFIFTFPLKKSSLPSIAIEEVEFEEVKKTEHITLPLSEDKPPVLIVEDNPEMSQFLVRSLSAYFHCQTAMDGQKALDLLEKGYKPNAIVSDVMMPNMDGFSFLKSVHSMEDFRRIPFILLTARAIEEDKIKGLHMGVDDYLTKPFSTKELIARLQNLLKNKTTREALPALDEIAAKASPNYEEQFVEKAEDLVLINLSNSDYRVSDFAKDLAYSPRQLERILKKITGFSPVEFIREIRLQKAHALMEKRQFSTVAEVRHEVGMENASFFTKKFKERFGKNPKDMMI